MKEWQRTVLILGGIAAFAYVADTWQERKPPARASSASETCVELAFTEYNRIKTAVLLQNTGVPMAATAIAIRRLQESYCHQFATCLLSPQQANMAFGSYFNRCLADEANEDAKYD